MANDDNAIGFVPVRHKKGGQIRTTPYAIASSYAVSLGRGDPVKVTGSSGTVYDYINEAVATTVTNRGVFIGVRYVDAQGTPVYSDYWTASTATKGAADAIAYVVDDPDVVFQIQCDTLAAGDVGALADWDTGTPSATTRKSGVELVSSSTATTGKSIRILGLSRTTNSDGSANAFGAYAVADVVFAEHDLATAAAGAGGS